MKKWQKNKLKIGDFDALARSLKINEKAALSIYKRFERVLRKWIALIERSFAECVNWGLATSVEDLISIVCDTILR